MKKLFSRSDIADLNRFDIGECSYCVIDAAKKRVCVTGSPQYGRIPDTVEYQGVRYTVADACIFNRVAPILNLEQVYLPDDVNILGWCALGFVYSPETFVIPRDLKFYGPMPFPHSPVVSNSPRFEVVNGLVIDKEKKRLVQCVNYMAEHIDVPSGIQEIADGAFYHCNLRSIHLPSGLKRIGEDAFWKCTNLETVILPASVEMVDSYAFAECVKLKDLFIKSNRVQLLPRSLNRLNVAMHVRAQDVSLLKQQMPFPYHTQLIVHEY